MKNTLKYTLSGLALALTLVTAQPAHADFFPEPYSDRPSQADTLPVPSQDDAIPPRPVDLQSVSTDAPPAGARKHTVRTINTSSQTLLVDPWTEHLSTGSDRNYNPMW